MPRFTMRPRRFGARLSVAENGWLLRRYAHLEERLLEVQGSWIYDLAPLELKIELGRLLYEDALHGDALRRRAAELFSEVDRDPPPPGLEGLDALAYEVLNAEDLAERLAGLAFLKSALAAAYAEHLARTDEVTDGPTAFVLTPMLAQEREHLDWLREQQAALAAEDPGAAERAAAWQQHLAELLQALGGTGLGGGQVSPDGLPFRNPRFQRPPFHRPPARDQRFQVIPYAEYFPATIDPADAVLHMTHNIVSAEVEAEEICARVIADFPDLPWGMKVELARQAWDEARHAEQQWRRLEELGGRLPLAPVALFLVETMGWQADPLERLIMLQRAAEGRAVDLHRRRYFYLRDERGDPATATLFDYTLADEKAHVGFSHWINELTEGDAERRARLFAIQKQGEVEFERLLNRRPDNRPAGIVGQVRE